jgi:L-ascorbate metabolism protein UlaG (beta-lactamase superfamily)
MSQSKNAPAYTSNPNLPIIKPAYPGNRLLNGKFTNEDKDVEAGFTKVLRWQLTRNPQKAEKKADPFRLKVIENKAVSKQGADKIVWLGHATFLIQLLGQNLLIDPVFGNLPLIPRKSALPCLPSNLTNIDHLLISHGHRDHLDKPSIQQVLSNNPAVQVLAPLQMQKLIFSFGKITQYQEAGWYQQYQIPGEVDILFLPAKHWHRRGLNDFNEILWGSFLIRTRQISIYFGGDSAYGEHFTHIRQTVGPVDICILPVGAYKPPFMMQGSHMNPTEAIQAFHDLQGKLLIPMHYGTFDLSDEPIGEPYRLLKQAQQENKIQGKLKLASVGEEILLENVSSQ